MLPDHKKRTPASTQRKGCQWGECTAMHKHMQHFTSAWMCPEAAPRRRVGANKREQPRAGRVWRVWHTEQDENIQARMRTFREVNTGRQGERDWGKQGGRDQLPTGRGATSRVRATTWMATTWMGNNFPHESSKSELATAGDSPLNQGLAVARTWRHIMVRERKARKTWRSAGGQQMLRRCCEDAGIRRGRKRRLAWGRGRARRQTGCRGAGRRRQIARQAARRTSPTRWELGGWGGDAAAYPTEHFCSAACNTTSLQHDHPVYTLDEIRPGS